MQNFRSWTFLVGYWTFKIHAFKILSLLFLAIAYAGVMLLYGYGWRKTPKFVAPTDFQPQIFFSVIIPARDEAHNIAACLTSIAEGDYPAKQLEVLVIDDFSTDDTAAMVETIAQKSRISIKLLQLKDWLSPDERLNAYKKKAIAIAIAQARGEVVVTTDADCIAPPQWLRLLAMAFEARPQTQAVCAPVMFHRERNLLQRFQALDFLGLMGITAAGIRLGFQRMGNGANLAYRKSAFEAVGGFEGDGRASGDDMFLLQKIAQAHPEGIFFLKNADAATRTEAMPDVAGFIRQRLRWGSKNAALPELHIKAILGVVFLFCWSLLIQGLLLPTGWVNYRWWLLQVAIKAAADYWFLRQMAIFFQRRDLLRWFWPAFLMHTIYVSGIGLGSLFVKSYMWKGRRVQ